MSTETARLHDLDSELISRVTRGIEQIRAGKMVILVDDEDRENEGDLVLAADKVTPEAIAFMANYGRGLICLTLTEEQIARLDLPMMAAPGRSILKPGNFGRYASGGGSRRVPRTIRSVTCCAARS